MFTCDGIDKLGYDVATNTLTTHGLQDDFAAACTPHPSEKHILISIFCAVFSCSLYFIVWANFIRCLLNALKAHLSSDCLKMLKCKDFMKLHIYLSLSLQH